jgi:hypothetical protein
MKGLSNPLNFGELAKLSNTFETLTFKNDFVLVYQNQVPSIGIALIEGEIELIKDQRICEIVKSPHLLGIYHLLHEQPSPIGCKIKANSKIIFIGKSMVLSTIKNKRSELFDLIREYA